MKYHTTKCCKMNKDSPFVLLTKRRHVRVRANKRSIHTPVFFQSFLRNLIPKRKPERSWVESTSSQWLCWPFLLPYGLRAISGVGAREEMHTWDEQEKVLTVLFDFSDCYHIALLVANCNCQLKQWGKVLLLPSLAGATCADQHSRYICVLFRMAQRGNIFTFCWTGSV